MSKQLLIIFFFALIAVAFGCTCTREFRPVCDNFGKQHNNMCLFKCAKAAAARENKVLKIAYDGPCH